MNGEIFTEVVFARGAGFGNRLFPWARCLLFSRRHGLRMLAPPWVQWRIGPLVRGGIDLAAYPRQILLLGLFDERNYVHGPMRAWVSATAGRVAEPTVDGWRPPSVRGNAIVSFAGYGNLFADVVGSSEAILHALRSDAQPRWVKVADEMAAPIGINVRCGRDFRQAATPQDYYQSGALRTPLSWFVRTLHFVRQAAGSEVPAVVVSDGTRAELADLLSIPGVRFARPGCAISDLLALARARVLIGSGGSSFSAWSAFLSGALSVTHPGQSLQWFRIGASNGAFIGELDPDHPPSGLAARIDAALSRWN